MRRILPPVILMTLLVAGGFAFYVSTTRTPRVVVFDLAERLPFAARASAREVILFGWPDAEPYLLKGFGGDPEFKGRERFLWVRQGASLKIDVPETRDRVLILDLEAYAGIEDQSLSITTNGHNLGALAIPSTRSRVRFDWPAVAQSATNQVVLQFSRAIVPARETGGSGDTRDFAAALFSMTLGDSRDKTMDLLEERATPRAYELSEKDGVPAFLLPGMSQTSFAFRLPEDAVLEFESALHPWSASSGGKGSLQVSFDAADGRARKRVEIPLGAARLEPTRIALKGAPGTPFMVRIDVVTDTPGLTFAQIRAPRVLGPAAPVVAPSTEGLAFQEALRKAKPNVLFIVLDAARAQSFGAYGHARATTPNIDKFSREGFTFDNAYTTAVYTLAAMSSVWTSQQPDRHHGDVAFSAKLPADRLMLAEVLTAQGIHTAGFVANGVAGAYNGFDRGFKEFDEPWKKHGSSAAGFRIVLPAFLDRMKGSGTRFFAYVHYREPHHPYDPPPPFDTLFGPDSPIPKELRKGGERTEKWTKDVNRGAIPFSPDEADHLRRLYDGNLAFADQEVGYLRGELESRGLLANTVVIVTGDHGEGLFEHGYIGHNAQVYDESARVPLIVSLPSTMRAGHTPARIAPLVDLTDIAPTILDLFDLSGAGGSARAFQGRSLIPYLKDQGPGDRDDREVLTRTVWERPVYALRNGSHTFIYNSATTEFSIFDRTSNPRKEGKDHDYAARAPIALRETYRQNLLAWVASLKRQTVSGDKLDGMPREQCEQMKALGYLSAAISCPEG